MKHSLNFNLKFKLSKNNQITKKFFQFDCNYYLYKTTPRSQTCPNEGKLKFLTRFTIQWGQPTMYTS